MKLMCVKWNISNLLLFLTATVDCFQFLVISSRVPKLPIVPFDSATVVMHCKQYKYDERCECVPLRAADRPIKICNN